MQKGLINKIRSVPTLPNILSQIIRTLDDPHSSAAELEKIIRNDQALTTKLLAVANSAYYGFRHQITTVRRAAVAIGFNEVRNICLGMSLLGFLHPSTFRDREAAEQLWLHSMAVSEACRILAEGTGAAEPAQAFTAGLLHDIGKVVVAAFAPDQYEALRAHLDREGCTYQEAEQALELGHQEVGRELCEYWDLPPMLVEAVGRHHAPNDRLVFFPLVALVNAGDYLARRGGIGFSGDSGEPRLHPGALRGMETGRRTVETCLGRLEQSREKVELYMSQLLSTQGRVEQR
jgi:putative nucleotidyltransferase with HDIG domain